MIQQKLRELEILAYTANVPMDDMLVLVERQFLVAALSRRKGNQCGAAIELGKHRNTISRKMDKLGLKRA